MNKLDTQFEQMMKGIRIDSPSSDFTIRVMSRIQAEAAVQRLPVLQNYQPVISKKTWIILIAAFVLLMIYVSVSGNETTVADQGIWSTLSGYLGKLQVKEVSSIWQTGTSLFAKVPSIAYLILASTLALWTLDGFLGRFKHHPVN